MAACSTPANPRLQTRWAEEGFCAFDSRPRGSRYCINQVSDCVANLTRLLFSIYLSVGPDIDYRLTCSPHLLAPFVFKQFPGQSMGRLQVVRMQLARQVSSRRLLTIHKPVRAAGQALELARSQRRAVDLANDAPLETEPRELVDSYSDPVSTSDSQTGDVQCLP